MLRETNNKELFILPRNPKKSDVNWQVKDSEDSKTTLSKCKHLSAIEELTKYFTDNFNLHPSKEKKSRKCNASHQKEILKIGTLLIILNDDETKDATSLNKEDKDKMLVMIEKDIQD
jgi:hypothetical protein